MGTKNTTIQIGQKIGTWTAGVAQEVEQNKDFNVLLYLAVPYPELTSLLPSNGECSEKLASLLWKWAQCFLIDKYDVGRTGPPYCIKLATGVPYKGYVPRQSPAAIAAIWEEV